MTAPDRRPPAGKLEGPLYLDTSALVKLYEDNASTLTPDPVHSAFYDSHPPAAIRIDRGSKIGVGSSRNRCAGDLRWTNDAGGDAGGDGSGCGGDITRESRHPRCGQRSARESRGSDAA